MTVGNQRVVTAVDERRVPSAAELVTNVSALVTPPTVCVKLFELVRSNSASARDIGEVLSLDPNLTARLLRIVNSPFYGFAATIHTIERAVTILGVRDLYNLVLAITAVRSFAPIGEGLTRDETFWKHSVFCALAARALGKALRLPDPERFFVAGLLHDLGACVVYSQLPEWVVSMREALGNGEAALQSAELDAFGYSHASIGSMVLEQWQLPPELLSAVNAHHHPQAASVGRVEAAVVHLADALAHGSVDGALADSPIADARIDDSVWLTLALDRTTFDAQGIVSAAADGFRTAMALLMPGERR